VAAASVWVVAAAIGVGCRPDAPTGIVDSGPKSVPGLTGREAPAGVLRGFLEPPPEGYEWAYGLDWDDAVVSKCLRSPSPYTTPVPDHIQSALLATAPPAGYQWLRDQASGRTVALCVVRIGCPHGKVPSTQECTVPR